MMSACLEEKEEKKKCKRASRLLSLRLADVQKTGSAREWHLTLALGELEERFLDAPSLPSDFDSPAGVVHRPARRYTHVHLRVLSLKVVNGERTVLNRSYK